MLTLGDDTFVSLDDADTYFAGRLGGEKWPGTDDDSVALKERALRTATAMLDRVAWRGSLTSSAQPLSWPRRYLSDWNGRMLPADLMPVAIANATAELALALLQNDLTDDQVIADLYAVKSKKIGDLAVTYGTRQRDQFPAVVRDLIRPYSENSRYNAVLRPC